jgi:hypothetical protein
MSTSRLKSPYNVNASPNQYAFSSDLVAVGHDVSTFQSFGQQGTMDQLFYKVHSFTTVGTYNITFSKAGFVDVLVIAGGGSGGVGESSQATGGGGGGAGGIVITYNVPVLAQTYSVIVGAGGASRSGASQTGVQGSNSSFNNIQAIGGGHGAGWTGIGGTGGSGGGNTGNTTVTNNATAGQGNVGGTSVTWPAAGGGGAGSPGGNATSGATSSASGDGGRGINIDFRGFPEYVCAGGSGGGTILGNITYPGGGVGGIALQAGGSATYFGSGGGGASNVRDSGAGFKGMVAIRYPLLNLNDTI